MNSNIKGKNISILHNLFQTIEEKVLYNLFYEANILQLIKPDFLKL